MASNPIVNMFKIKELRNRLFFTLMVLAVFRLGSVLTIPGIDASALLSYFDNLAKTNKNAFASYMDFFVGGAFSNFSIFNSLNHFLQILLFNNKENNKPLKGEIILA